MARKKSSATPPARFRVELVYAERDPSGGFGLLADLLLDEILRQRQATADKTARQTQPVSTEGAVHSD
jgi:hypothetical protein